MGKGDIKTRKGKITNKSYGKKRSHKLNKKTQAVNEEKNSEQSA